MASGYDADPIFQALPRQIDNLLHRIHEGALTIPDFQRDFVWEAKRTQELLRSVMSRFPAGTLLFWATGGDNASFGWREVEGAPKASVAAQELILDGQQRLTSLYRALNWKGDERFYLKLSELWIGNAQGVRTPTDVDFDNALFWIDNSAKDSGKYSTEESQYDADVFPVDLYRNFDEWLDGYVDHRNDVINPAETKKVLRRVRDEYLTPLKSYGFPVVTLPVTTSIDAVCNVFETLNRTGKPLGAFELLTARFYPKGIRLRDLWSEALDASPMMRQFNIEPYAVMQAISLRAYNSAQRSTVLNKVEKADIDQHWTPVVRGFNKVLDLLESDCGVLSPNMLPYSMLLIPMAACWEEVQNLKGPSKAAATEQLKKYFWATAFTSNFDQGANSQAGADYLRLREWLLDGTRPAPEAISDLVIAESTLVGATTRRKALNSGVLALTVKNGARDFHSGLKLTAERLRADRIDSHHIFPKAFLSSRDAITNGRSAELSLNRALIDPASNKAISKSPPSKYFPSLSAALSSEAVAEILDSHLIDADDTNDPFLTDDYLNFIRLRAGRVIEQIEAVTGKEVSRDVDWSRWLEGKSSYTKS